MVQLRLKQDAEEFLDAHRVRGLIRKYSDHIAFPVRMETDSREETVNRAKALWARPKRRDQRRGIQGVLQTHLPRLEDPLIWTHNRVEGKREYSSLLYVPSVAPFDLWNREAPRGVKLYVQRVFITDQAAQFLPLYLRFVRGVVDTSELSLNVSRELLQQDEAIAAMRAALTRRVLDMLERLAGDDAEKYAKFWSEFGLLLKEGLVEDLQPRANREAATLQYDAFDRHRAESKLEAVSRGRETGAGAIYFLVAESPNAARSSPHLEAFRGARRGGAAPVRPLG